MLLTVHDYYLQQCIDKTFFDDLKSFKFVNKILLTKGYIILMFHVII
jgi:hypothetical protein